VSAFAWPTGTSACRPLDVAYAPSQKLRVCSIACTDHCKHNSPISHSRPDGYGRKRSAGTRGPRLETSYQKRMLVSFTRTVARAPQNGDERRPCTPLLVTRGYRTPVYRVTVAYRKGNSNEATRSSI